jgi:hypothetical protein
MQNFLSQFTFPDTTKMILTAGDISEVTFLGGHPEVGRTCVKHHLEVLWGGADSDHSVVLGLQ